MAAEAGALSSLGVDKYFLLGQIVSFLILFFLLRRLLYKPVLKKLDERADLVQKGIKAAQASLEAQEKMEIKRQQELKKTQKQVVQIIAKAKTDGQRAYEQLLEQGKLDAQKIISQEKNKFEGFIKEQENQLKKKIVDLAAQMTQKTLSQFLDTNKHRQIVDNQIKELS